MQNLVLNIRWKKRKLDICVNNIPVFGMSGNEFSNDRAIFINCTFASGEDENNLTTVHIDHGEVSLNKTMNVKDENMQQYIYTITSFHFTDNNQPVMTLLNDSLNGASRIVDELSNI